MSKIKAALWALLARIVSQPRIATWLIKRAQRTPYYPINARNSDALYMDRWWLFNPYGKDAQGRTTPPRWPGLPSVRVHHICLPDDDQHEHNHPWDARTIILRGYYLEERQSQRPALRPMLAGDTAAINADDFHRVISVSRGGVFTLFFTWQYIADWGFQVDGKTVPWRTYLGIDTQPTEKEQQP